ncbi:hypothetical protein JRC04_07755 [Mycolicibacterium sp. S2-37]|uniref:glycosyltransferase family 9 protein n=1 Tax=Mycolicibacterium sp. S2-37 TaxID=2810297 RepID=UPI001A9412CB|nr:glycosyltransferase family 9 protein [Mycolicibacterium sp. S2-37]MBO0677354.1 hypothetical protein [Mycolicibacterium sp. S2-37]
MGPTTPTAAQASSTAVFFANNIGDAILTLPTLRALGRLFPAPITVLAPKVHYDLCFHEVSPRFVDIGSVVPNPHRTPLPVTDAEFDALAAQIGAVELFINAVPYRTPSQLVARRLRSRLRPATSIGFAGDDDVYDIAVPKSDGHSADLIFGLARLFSPDARVDDHAGRLDIPAHVVARARRVRADLPPGSKVLVVHADTEWTIKQWPVTRFIALLDRFLARHREYVAWVVGMGHEELNVGSERARVTPLLGLPLDLTMALVETADLFVGIDSSVLHAADLARVPGVGLFGPTRSSMWGFRFGPHRHVDRASMADIGVQDVLDALEQLT